MKIIDFSSSDGELGSQIRFEDAPKGEQNQVEGAKSNLREKKSSKKRQREPQEAPKEPESHDPLALSIDYELQRSNGGDRPSFDPASAQLRWT